MGARIGVYNKLYANSIVIAITFDGAAQQFGCALHLIRVTGRSERKSLYQHRRYTNTATCNIFVMYTVYILACVYMYRFEFQVNRSL